MTDRRFLSSNLVITYGRALVVVAAMAVLCGGIPGPARAAQLHACADAPPWYSVRASGNCQAARAALRRWGRFIATDSRGASAGYRYRSRGWSCFYGQQFRCRHARKGSVVGFYAYD